MKLFLKQAKTTTELLLVLTLTACSSAYYKTMESLGVHKRDILVFQVEKARSSQEEAKQQFQSALEEFSAITNFKSGELQEKYENLKSEFDKSKAKADDIRFHIAEVEDVAEALFDEWGTELEQYSNVSLRRNSERKLSATKKRYIQLITAMKRAETKIDPVLSAFQDQVLYMKHNLNAQAVTALKSEFETVEADIATLIKEMEKSINEADSFIKSLEA